MMMSLTAFFGLLVALGSVHATEDCKFCPTPRVAAGCHIRETLEDTYVPYPQCCPKVYCDGGGSINDPACDFCPQPRVAQGCDVIPTDDNAPWPICCPQVVCNDLDEIIAVELPETN